jgi:hypothetical protein
MLRNGQVLLRRFIGSWVRRSRYFGRSGRIVDRRWEFVGRQESGDVSSCRSYMRGQRYRRERRDRKTRVSFRSPTDTMNHKSLTTLPAIIVIPSSDVNPATMVLLEDLLQMVWVYPLESQLR